MLAHVRTLTMSHFKIEQSETGCKPMLTDWKASAQQMHQHWDLLHVSTIVRIEKKPEKLNKSCA